MAYVDGFVTPVLADGDEAYRAMAGITAPILREHGALRVVEALGDDVPRGERTDYWRAVAAGDGERIALSWVVWPDKAARDAGWAKLMADERMKCLPVPPFDPGRMIFGGFEVFLDTDRDRPAGE